jgi:hypothetical protein
MSCIKRVSPTVFISDDCGHFPAIIPQAQAESQWGVLLDVTAGSLDAIRHVLGRCVLQRSGAFRTPTLGYSGGEVTRNLKIKNGNVDILIIAA